MRVSSSRFLIKRFSASCSGVASGAAWTTWQMWILSQCLSLCVVCVCLLQHTVCLVMSWVSGTVTDFSPWAMTCLQSLQLYTDDGQWIQPQPHNTINESHSVNQFFCLDRLILSVCQSNASMSDAPSIMVGIGQSCYIIYYYNILYH